MIKLFITDLDGCLSRPFHTPDWELISEIRKLNNLSKTDEAVPPLSICSGRPLPYVEAVAQWMDIRLPVVFESAGLYKLATNDIEVAPIFDDEAQKEVSELKAWLRKEIIPRHEGMELEFSKLMDAGLIHIDQQVIDAVYPDIVDYVTAAYERFEAHKTEVSVNIIMKENNKRNGITMLCNALDLKPAEVAYIGDSSGDIPGLKFTGHPFAPKNAIDEVKEVAKVTEAHTTAAVLEVYEKVIAYNQLRIRNEEF